MIILTNQATHGQLTLSETDARILEDLLHVQLDNGYLDDDRPLPIGDAAFDEFKIQLRQQPTSPLLNDLRELGLFSSPVTAYLM